MVRIVLVCFNIRNGWRNNLRQTGFAGDRNLMLLQHVEAGAAPRCCYGFRGGTIVANYCRIVIIGKIRVAWIGVFDGESGRGFLSTAMRGRHNALAARARNGK